MNDLGNTYEASNSWHARETGLFGLGLRTYRQHDIEMNTSLRFLPVMEMSTQGEVLQLYSSDFRNLAYTYDITSNFLLVDHIVTWTKYRFKPGFLVGLGGVSNETSHYSETALNPNAAPSLDHFTAENQLQFAYELGAVLDYTYNPVLTIECSYRYLNAGHGQLGLSSLQNTSYHLSTGLIDYHTFSIGVRLYHEI